jgi:hypothetical protein
MNKKARAEHAQRNKKALHLNRETLRQLEPPELSTVRGAVPTDGCSFKPGTFGCCEWN